MKKQKVEKEKAWVEFEATAVEGLRSGQPLLGEGGIVTGLVQRLLNVALEGELDEHLELSRQEGEANRRNGHTQKVVRSDVGPLDIRPPRDRAGSFEPRLIGKWTRELGTGVSEQILSLYGQGMGMRQIQDQLYSLYGLEYSLGSISAVTERIWEEVSAWRNRALNSSYVVIFLDAIHYKTRESGKTEAKVIYTAYGVTMEGNRDVLGLYTGDSEGSRTWGVVLEDLRKRGVEEVFFFCVDGLAGFVDVINLVFPFALVQRCIVHMIRSSTRFVSYKDRKAVCQGLRKIYTASDVVGAELALEGFSSEWDKRYPDISRLWRESWSDLTPFLDYGEHLRRLIYTTNSVEALHRVMRKSTKTKGAWVNEKGLLKQLYLCLTNNEKSWKKQVHNWTAVQNELIKRFGERYTKWLDKV